MTPIPPAIPDGLGWAQGEVLGVTVHGLLEDKEILRAIFGKVPTHTLDAALDELTDVVMANVDIPLIDGLAVG